MVVTAVTVAVAVTPASMEQETGLAGAASRHGHELVEHQGRCCRRCKDDKGRTLRNQKRPTSFSKA